MDPTVKNIYFTFLCRSRRQIKEGDRKPRVIDKDDIFIWLTKEWIKGENS